MKKNGMMSVSYKATKNEYKKLLKEKLTEELKEFLLSEDDEELADILEVIRTICIFNKKNFSSIERLRKIKKREKGGFGHMIVLEYEASRSNKRI
jgi:predicted house-cleaning noncanonical NTP pyrophosphatase (MazG superfamily)